MDFRDAVFDPARESERLKKLSRRYAKEIETISNLPVPKAAVLLAIFQYRGRPHVILTERGRNLRTHPGQVALPGGKLDPGESIVDAALREAEEEIGLDRAHVQVVGTSLPMCSSIAKVSITPVVGFIGDIQAITLKSRTSEVESVFAVPLEAFPNSSEFTLFQTLRFPKVVWSCAAYKKKLGYVENIPALLDLFEKERTYNIWGVTAVILDVYSAVFFHTHPLISNNDGGSVQFMTGFFREFSSRI